MVSCIAKCVRAFPVLSTDAARDSIRRYKMDQLAAVRSIRGSVTQAEELRAQCARTQAELDKLRALVRHTMAAYKPLARTSGPLLPSQVRAVVEIVCVVEGGG